MRRITRDSYFAYLSKNFINESKVSLIDKEGELNQVQAFKVYTGIINELASFGIKKNNVCLLSASSKKETVLLIAAIISLGAIVFLKDPKIEDKKFCEDLDVSVKTKASVFYDGGWVVKGKRKQTKLTLTEQDLKVKVHMRNRKDKASIYFPTSGSSGKNKIVCLSEYAFLNHVLRQHHCAGKMPAVGYLCLPLYHIFGLEMLSIYFTSQSAVYVSDSRNPELALDTIEKYHCTSIPNVPTFYFMLMDIQKKDPRNVSSLKYGVIAGGAYSAEQFRSIEKFFNMILVSTYGLSEGCTTLTDTISIKNSKLRSSGVGKPFPGINVIFKDNNNKKHDSSGEICFKGYNLMLGYLRKEGYYLPLDDEGYFHTGDIGQVDEYGIWHIIGRKKDIIIRGGENLSPSLISQKICTIDGVKDVVVIGLKDEKYGEIVAAYVASDSYSDQDLLKEKMKNVLTKHELPSKIIIEDSIPLNEAGKPDKKLIRSLLENA